MSHLRTQIREAIASTLADGLATVPADHVYLSRIRPLERETGDVNSLLVQSGGETIDPKTLGVPRLQTRTLQVDVIVAVSGTGDLESRLDAVILDVEKALCMPLPVALHGLKIKQLSLLNIDRPQLEQSDIPVGQAALNYAVTYMTAENAPDIPR